jgi:hypothetical protein
MALVFAADYVSEASRMLSERIWSAAAMPSDEAK